MSTCNREQEALESDTGAGWPATEPNKTNSTSTSAAVNSERRESHKDFDAQFADPTPNIRYLTRDDTSWFDNLMYKFDQFRKSLLR